MDTLSGYSAEQRERVFSSEYAMTGCLQVVNRLWLLEAQKPKDTQRWEPILEVFEEFANRARSIGAEVLWASAVRASVMVLAEYTYDLVAARDLTDVALSIASNDPRVQYLIRESIGRQYTYNKQFQEALAWLEEALSYYTVDFPIARLYTLLTAGLAAGELNAASAINYLKLAVELANNDTTLPETELVRALGELAVAHWLAGDLKASFDAWDIAAERLLSARSDDDMWKDLFTLFGHTSGFLSMMAGTGRAIERTRSGEIYAPPFRGIFIQALRAERARLYDPAQDCVIFAQLAHFAEAVGQYERATAWARLGIDAARVSKRPLVVSDLGFSISPHFVIAGQYEEALELGLEAGGIQIALTRLRNEGVDFADATLEIDALLSGLSEEEHMRGEYGAVIGVLLPIAFQLHRLVLTGPARVQIEASAIASMCRQISETARNRTLWSTAADALDKTFLDEATGHELVELGNSLNQDEYNVLRIIYYLGAITKRDVGIEDVALGQLAIMPSVQRLLSIGHAAYSGIVLPYLVEFWSARFRRARALFGSPQYFEEELAQATMAPADIRAQRILFTVAKSLRIRPPLEVSTWLAGNG